MKYRIAGADRETGEDIELVLDGQTEAEARAKANARGILVSAVIPQSRPAAEHTGQPRDAQPQFSGTRSSHRRTTEFLKDGNQTQPARSNVLRYILIGGAAIVIAVAVAFPVLRARQKSIDSTLQSAITQIDKTQESARQNSERQIAEAKEKTWRAEQQEQARQAAAGQLKKAYVDYVDTAQPFVREAKALKARIATGISLQAYDEKVAAMIDAYGQLGDGPSDVAAFARAANDLMQNCQQTDKRWSLLLRNNHHLDGSPIPLSFIDKKNISEWLDDNDSRISTLITEIEKLKDRAR